MSVIWYLGFWLRRWICPGIPVTRALEEEGERFDFEVFDFEGKKRSRRAGKE
jgi:hypothetical protein